MMNSLTRCFLCQFARKSIHLSLKRSAFISNSFSPSSCEILCGTGYLFPSPSQRRWGSSGTTTTKDLIPKTKEELQKEKSRAKKGEPPPVMLIDEKKSISTVTLEDAAKIAKKKGLILVEATDADIKIKPGKKVYKLVSKIEHFGQTNDTPDAEAPGNKTKEDKVITLKSRTGEHDVTVKAKQILRLIGKGFPVRVIIGDVNDQTKADAVNNILEDHFKEWPVRVAQKVTKGSQIRLHVIPPKTVPKVSKPASETKPEDNV